LADFLRIENLYNTALGKQPTPKKYEMRIITGLLQFLAIAALVLGTFLLVVDPRLRGLVVEDLSLVVPWTKSSEGESTTANQGSSHSSKTGQGSPTVTESGYTISSGCALWTVEGLDLYYSPADPTALCVQAPGSTIKAGSPLPPGAEMPFNCAVAPDSVVYCLADGPLSADTLAAFYERGELQTPRESKGNGG
jgi:hypothetical protein